MNVEELRVGNLVYSDGDFLGKVESLGSDKASLYEKGGLDNYGYHRISGIPLTEEWLLKFGFKKAIYESTHDDFCDEICYELEYKRDFFMSYADDFSLTLFVEKKMQHEELGICPNLKDLRNVHQLQNLYFALTSEELEIK